MSTRTALLIATGTYTDTTFRQLHASRQDATQLAEVLADAEIGDYQVSTLENRPSHQVRLRINKLFAQAGSNDLILLYFSGHGVKDAEGDLHLATTDTQRSLLDATAVSAHFVRKQIDRSNARKVVVWLDCCYGGAFPSGMIPKAEGTVDVLPQLASESGCGCAVMSASTSIQFAFEPGEQLNGQSPLSVFTDAIVTGLRTGDADLNADGEIDAKELYDYVYKYVQAVTPNQTPTRNDQITGELYIARSKRGMRLHTDLPGDIRRLLLSTNPYFRSAAVQALAVLTRSDDPHQRMMAQDALRGLRTGADRDLAHEAEQALTPIEPLPPSQPVQRLPTPLRATPRATESARLTLPTGRKRVLAPLVAKSFLLGIGLACAAAITAVITGVSGWLSVPIVVGLAIGALYFLAIFWKAYSREFASTGITLFKFSSAPVQDVIFRPDGARLYAVVDMTAYVWDTGSWDGTWPYGESGIGRCLAFDPAGVILAGGRRNQIQLMNSHDLADINLLTGHTSTVGSLSFSPNGSVLASADRVGNIMIWSASDWIQTETFLAHENHVTSVAFSPNGAILASGSWDKTIKLWDAGTWGKLRTFSGHRRMIRSVAFSPDGTLLASSSADRTIRLWDVATGDLVKELVDSSRYGAIAFSPDGALFAYGTDHGSIRLDETTDWTLADMLLGHHKDVRSVAFSPDGALLASAGDDRTLRLWEITHRKSYR